MFAVNPPSCPTPTSARPKTGLTPMPTSYDGNIASLASTATRE